MTKPIPETKPTSSESKPTSSEVTKPSSESKPARIVLLYADAGMGKTTLATKAPKSIILDLENGSKDIIGIEREEKAKTKQERIAFYREFVKSDKKTLIVDSMSFIEKKEIDYIITTDFGGDETKFNSFMVGYKHLKRSLIGEIEIFEKIREAGKNVIIIAHSRTKTVSDPMGADFDRYEPDIHKDVVSSIAAKCDAIFFMRQQIRVDNDNKAKSNMDRVLYTQPHPAYLAKTRGTIEPVITNPDGKLWESYLG